MPAAIRASMYMLKEFAGFKEAKPTCKITRGELRCDLMYHADLDKISFQFYTEAKPKVRLRRYGAIAVYVDTESGNVIGGWIPNVSFKANLEEFANMLWANTSLDERMVDKLVSALVNCVGAYNPTYYQQDEFHH